MSPTLFFVIGGRKEQMVEVFASNQLETSISVHTNHCSLRYSGKNTYYFI